MIHLRLADAGQLASCQRVVTAEHYLRTPVDVRCSPLAYRVCLDHPNGLAVVGCLIFGRPEATRCYDGALTYGSLDDVTSGKAQYSRWEILNLARVWLSPQVQFGGIWYRPDMLPGYIDRRGQWRSALASHVLDLALEQVGYDYLSQRPPVFPEEPYVIRAVLSYCDTRQHRGTIYRAAGFERARINANDIETWYIRAVAPLTNSQDDIIQKLTRQSQRSRMYRSERAVQASQETWL